VIIDMAVRSRGRCVQRRRGTWSWSQPRIGS
jgi:hypothetical protein